MPLLDELMEIHGIGPKLAAELAPKLTGTASARQQLKVASFFDTLPIITRYDLTYNPVRSIPRRDLDNLHNTLRARLRGKRHLICGSYRRGKPYSSDIDMVIICKGWDDFQRRAQLADPHVYADGQYKTAVIFKMQPHDRADTTYYAKMDIFYATPANYDFMTLFATGSGQFNVFMRWKAQKLGMKLNQNGLFKGNNRLPIKGTRAIFAALGLPYIAPRRRASKWARTWQDFTAK